MSRPEIVPVRVLRFAVPMDAHGLSVASSCSSRTAKRDSRHEIFWLPYARQFELRYHQPDGPVLVSMIPEVHVKSWDPIDPPSHEPVKDAAEVQRRK